MTDIRIDNPWQRAGEPTIADALVMEYLGTPLVIVTEKANNPGLSITNNAEAIVKELTRRHGPGIIIVEHYDDTSYPSGNGGRQTFDRVRLNAAGDAQWIHLGSTFPSALEALNQSATA